MLKTDQYKIIKADVSYINRIKEINSFLPYDNWSEENFMNSFKWDLPVFVIKDLNDLVVGYSISLFCLEEVKIINVMIDPKYQGQGYGKAIMLHVLHDAISQGIQYAMLDVRVINTAAISLYHQLGFRVISVRPNYYTDKIICDAYLMQLRLK